MHANRLNLLNGPNCGKLGRMLVLAGSAALLLVAGCRQDMHNQPKMIPQRGTDFFADHRGARPQVVDTVARGQLDESSYFYTGLVTGPNGYRHEQDLMPFAVTMDVIRRGQERFNIYCTPCHSRVGNGAGMIVERGYKPAGNFHDPKRLAEPLSHYFYVMTNGYGAMPDYKAQIAPVDRWAIAAYIRALQLSQSATVADVPAGAQVRNLPDIAQSLGEPASYAGPWPMPATAVYGQKTIGIAAGAPAEAVPQSSASGKPAMTKGETQPTGVHK